MSNQKLPHLSILLDLRHNKGMSLKEIGDLYGASRERVRQKIGNTGREFLANFFSKKPIFTNEEMTTGEAIKFNHKRQKSRVANSMRRIHHAVEGEGSQFLGNEAERIVSEKLLHLGIPNTMMALHHPFDILLNNGIRVDVKTSKCTAKTSPSQKSTMYRFGVKKDMRGDYCDFFICLIYGTEDFFVLPNREINNVYNIYISWPIPRSNWSKWHKYHNRFDLLKK